MHTWRHDPTGIKPRLCKWSLRLFAAIQLRSALIRPMDSTGFTSCPGAADLGRVWARKCRRHLRMDWRGTPTRRGSCSLRSRLHSHRVWRLPLSILNFRSHLLPDRLCVSVRKKSVGHPPAGAPSHQRSPVPKALHCSASSASAPVALNGSKHCCPFCKMALQTCYNFRC